MIQFQEIQPLNLDLSTGQLTDHLGNPVNFKSTTSNTFEEEIKGLMNQEKPPKLEAVLKAIQKHPEIPEDQKQKLMDFATGLETKANI